MRERSCRGLCSDGGGGEKKKERERVARAAAAHLKVPLLFRVTCGGPQWRRRRRSYKRERETERICTLDRQSQRAFQIAAAAASFPSSPSASMGVFGRVWEIVRGARAPDFYHRQRHRTSENIKSCFNCSCGGERKTLSSRLSSELLRQTMLDKQRAVLLLT